jgi:ABC-type bacteriocin/lantibiotic exporter with double-glycine peptidase domain
VEESTWTVLYSQLSFTPTTHKRVRFLSARNSNFTNLNKTLNLQSHFQLTMAIEKQQQENENSGGIQVQGMQFSYDGLQQQPPLFLDFNLHVSPGSRCLLVGANGSGN